LAEHKAGEAELVIEDPTRRATSDLIASKYAIALTGISTESGVPDFRSPQGIWSADKEAEAKAYERYELFLRTPKSYWEEMSGDKGTHGVFYGEVRKAEPNPGHYPLVELEKLSLIKCVITQNIDGLHEKAGSKSIIYYHGSAHKLRCPSCNSRYEFDEVSLENCRLGANAVEP
jgi:NAD-dependent deacetylase